MTIEGRIEMREDEYILSIDEGTTTAKAIVVNKESKILGHGKCEFPQYYPRPGWVEQDPEELWHAQVNAITEALDKAEVEPENIKALGLTNQRETTLIWDENGDPVYNAIVWQCKRTTDIVEKLKEEKSKLIREKTGLVPDSYFSGPKIKWLLENVPRLREKAEKGSLFFGTVDSFLIWKLSGGKTHVIDYSNASRTMCFNIHSRQWDEELLEMLEIPKVILPEVRPSSEVYAYTDPTIFGEQVPIAGAAGDQQAALFGQACYHPGMVKSTYGTGNFVLMHTGEKILTSENLLTTIAWGINGKVEYALEGSIFITGEAVQWLKNSLKIINKTSEIEELASSLQTNEGVYFVPAFCGLGAPYWDQFARGLVIGITGSTTRAHFARAVLESIAYLTKDVIREMEKESGISVKELRVDGGATKNNFLMQFQSDILDKKVVRPFTQETTSLGAAYLAGLEVGYWRNQEEIQELWKRQKEFAPKMTEERRQTLYTGWRTAVKRARGWEKIRKNVS